MAKKSENNDVPKLITELPASVVGNWIPSSPTAITRLRYNFRSFPELLIASVEFCALHSGKLGTKYGRVWKQVYGRNLTGLAMIELLDIQFESVKYIVAINRQTGHNHMDIIISAGGLDSTVTSGFVPRYVNLIETEKDGGKEAKPMRARITEVQSYDGEEARELLDPVYRQSLAIVVQSRLHTNPSSGYDLTVRHENLTDFPKIKNTSKESDPGPTELSKKENAKLNYERRLRSRVTLDVTKISQTFHVHFDTVAGFRKGTNLAELFIELFGDELSDDKIDTYYEVLQHTMGSGVQRAYKKREGTMIQERWDRPFQVKEFEMHSDEHDVSEGQTVFDQFWRKYDKECNDKPPLVSDGVAGKGIPGQKKSWFPMEVLELAFEQPVSFAPFARQLALEIDNCGFLGQPKDDLKAMFERMGSEFVTKIFKPREPETRDLLELERDKPRLENADPFVHGDLKLLRPQA